MIPWLNFGMAPAPHWEPAPDPRLDPVDGDEIDEIVNWQLSKEAP